ncbi:GumC family protein [Mesonia maritima]|uniref:non-specific protein-tyrosine kinase n=1 Tax=Mesonia maritima TaxID=1793873 RepID=A0ABU1K9V9_9FLAO|nr:polysaccharide biosynthesis tyrosine autokinase [Mesonia maritima]MDR6301827.1 capsular exopolysaccharide synthesis family protein [Mesonia maritima]
MIEQAQQPYQNKEEEQGEDLKQLIVKYLRYWPWFVGTVILALFLAFIYLRYAPKIFQTNTEIKVLKENESGLDLTGLQGASTLFDMSKVNLENEIQILKSRRILGTVVNDLELSTRYYKEGNVKNAELWKENVPFNIRWNLHDSLINKEEEKLFRIIFTEADKFIAQKEGSEEEKNAILNEAVNVEGYTFEVILNEDYTGDYQKALQDEVFLIAFNAPEKVVNSLSRQIQISPVGEKSEILNISLKGQTPPKNEAILNRLTYQFNHDGIRDKQRISERTGEFIDERLKFLFKELDTVERGIVDYKQDNDFVDIEANATQLFTKEGQAEARRYELETQKAVAEDFSEVLKQGEEYTLLPANLGIENESVNTLTESYNESVLQREKLLISGTQQNPLILNLEEKLNRIKKNITRSVTAYINSLEISLRNIRQRENVSSGQLGTLPKKEKEIRAITRQREVKEKLYLFLLQKREEAALQFATTAPTIKMVDYAYTQPEPVAPKSAIILLAALILGLLLPFGVLYVKFLLDTKISNKEQVKRLLGSNIPVVAEIPQVEKQHAVILKAFDRTVIAEAFRILRTNLSYFKSPDKKLDEAQVIYVTSSTKGEGKTFTSINLASTLAATGKKVLLMGCDLRNPQLHTYIKKGKNAPGVSSYLYDSSVNINDMVIKEVLDIKNLDIILSGSIPPNPAELLLNGRYDMLMEYVKGNYDYVIVDTAPTILVTDTLLISNHADLTVYVARANYTDIKLMEHIKEMYHQQKLKNIALVINGVEEKGGYGYNYGYGYGYSEASPVSRWKFWKR